MKTLLTYDVSEKQTEVKTALISKGYSKQYKTSGVTYYLPNTTVWKDGISPATAIADVKAITAELKVKLIRAAAVDFNSFDGIQGESN